MTRRDRCHLIARRALRLSNAEAALAWHALAIQVDSMGEMDVPKFRDLIRAVRRATIVGRKK